MKYKKVRNRAMLSGFSLIETAMVLLIMGVVIGTVLKGKDILSAAKIRSTAEEINCLKIAYDDYVLAYNALPGDDNTAAAKFAGATSGDGDGKYSEEDVNKVFPHLYFSGRISSVDFRAPSVGGKYTWIEQKAELRLQIAHNGKGVLTRKQIFLLKDELFKLLGDDSVLETGSTLSEKEADTDKYVVCIRF